MAGTDADGATVVGTAVKLNFSEALQTKYIDQQFVRG